MMVIVVAEDKQIELATYVLFLRAAADTALITAHRDEGRSEKKTIRMEAPDWQENIPVTAIAAMSFRNASFVRRIPSIFFKQSPTVI